MKTRFIVLGFCGAALLAVASALALARRLPQPAVGAPTPQQIFHVKGTVRAVDAEARTIRIAHEEIPGYMPAMTMPFAVRDAGWLKGLSAGDSVNVRLRVTEDNSWIDRIEKLGTVESGFASRAAETAPAREVERIQAGETVPDFALRDQDGRPVRLRDFKGQAVLLTFIYTRCPIPNFCPLMTKNFADLERRLSGEFADRAHLLSISIDPDFDRPEVLKNYAARYRADTRHWTFATGTREQIEFAGALFGLMQEPAGGLINHDLRTALIGPDGRLVQVWKSNVWTPYEVQPTVRETLTGARDVAAR
jgi:protein SCO1/2